MTRDGGGISCFRQPGRPLVGQRRGADALTDDLDGPAPDLRTLRALLDRLHGEEGILLHCASREGGEGGASRGSAQLRRRRPSVLLNAPRRKLLHVMSVMSAFGASA
jgi:hypothetical protein